MVQSNGLRRPTAFWYFFGTSGRLSRVPFTLGVLLFVCVKFSTFILAFGLADPRLSTDLSNPSWLWRIGGYALNTFFFCLWVATPTSLALLSVRRIHDIGGSGLFVLILIALFYFTRSTFWFAMIALMLWPGTDGANGYGPVSNRPFSRYRRGAGDSPPGIG